MLTKENLVPLCLQTSILKSNHVLNSDVTGNIMYSIWTYLLFYCSFNQEKKCFNQTSHKALMSMPILTLYRKRQTRGQTSSISMINRFPERKRVIIEHSWQSCVCASCIRHLMTQSLVKMGCQFCGLGDETPRSQLMRLILFLIFFSTHAHICFFCAFSSPPTPQPLQVTISLEKKKFSWRGLKLVYRTRVASTCSNA